MGGLVSSDPCVAWSDGGEKEFRDKYLQDGLLGQGEFGKVVLFHDKDGHEKVAVKILEKGIVFKDDRMYAPLDSKVLQAECDILRELNGKDYCLALEGIYETRKVIYVVTELCCGGEMMDYVSKQAELRTEDVSRISFQLLSAIDHCAKHGIIHRDVKAENVMFQSQKKHAQLRLIDFGSGTFDGDATASHEPIQHSTYVGSSFYMSPDMFEHSYTNTTDVWSTAVTLYVLVAGYPANGLREAFNILHATRDRNLRLLPNLPSNLPNSYFDLMEQLLTLHGSSRPSAGSLLKHEFVQFHRLLNKRRMRWGHMTSVRFEDSVKKHGMALQYHQFECAVTTILATVLSPNELTKLLRRLDDNDTRNSQKLRVVSMEELQDLLKEFHHEECIDMIRSLPNASSYDAFAYHIPLLDQFSRGNKQQEADSSRPNAVRRSISVVNSRVSPLPGARKYLERAAMPSHMRVQSEDVVCVDTSKALRDPPPTFTSSKSWANVWKDDNRLGCFESNSFKCTA